MADLQKLNMEAVSTVDSLNSFIRVADAADYEICAKLWKAGRDMMAEIDAAYDSIIAAAHKAHKEAVATKKRYYEPVETATKRVKSLMAAYDSEQERIRREEQARLEAEARKQAEEQRLQEALEAESCGQPELADALISEPVAVAPVVVPKAVPKIEGGPVYREVWKFRIVNPALIPREYLMPDEKKIGGVARSLKNQTRIPGIEVYSEKV